MKKKQIYIRYGICIFIIFILFFLLIVRQSIKRNSTIETEIFPIEIVNLGEELFFVGMKYNGSSLDATSNMLYSFNKNEQEIYELLNRELCKITLIHKITKTKNRIFALTQNKIKETNEIWEIDKKGVILKKYEVSKYIGSIFDIKSICIDGNMTCYLKDIRNKNTICINLESGSVCLIKDSNQQLSFESMAITNDNTLIILFCKSKNLGGGYELYEIINGDMELLCDGNILPYNDIYSVMGTGDNNLEVYIKGTNSIHLFNREDKNMKLIQMLDLNQYEFTKSLFMDNNSLLVMGMNTSQIKDEVYNKIVVNSYDLGGNK